MPYPVEHLIQTCTVHLFQSGADIDELGNPVKTETVISDVRCRLQTMLGTVTTEGVSYAATMVLLPGIDIQEDDKVECSGKLYWVNSVKEVYEPAVGIVSHIVATLRETAERKRLR